MIMLPDWPELAGAQLAPVTEGMSGATLYRVSRPGRPLCYLKLADGVAGADVRREAERTRWLARHGVTVPEILRAEASGECYAVLTHALPGAPAADSELPAGHLADILADALAALHRIRPEGCPFDESLDARLRRAAEDVAAGRVDPAHFDDRNASTAPRDLLARLQAKRPPEDLVVVHGDATLSNLIIDAAGAVGFVDCGHAGRGDRYLDLAVLAGEIADAHGHDAAARFGRRYGVAAWDAAKARYYSDLYELF